MGKLSAERKSRVFISYAREDSKNHEDFAEVLRDELRALRFDAYLDKHDILPGEDWKTRLSGLITNADAIVFCISPKSVKSEVCDWEVNEAERLGKRVLPVMCVQTNAAEVPPRLQRLNYIFLRHDDDRQQGLEKLTAAIETDIGWLRQHTQLAGRASDWQAGHRSTSKLLRGADLEAAEAWRDSPAKNVAQISQLHLEFIQASRRWSTRTVRRRAAIASVIAIVALVLAGLATLQTMRVELARDDGANAANGIVSNLAQRFRGHQGIRQSLIEDVLKQAKGLAEQLDTLGEARAEIIRPREFANRLLTLGDARLKLKQGRGAAHAELSETLLSLGRLAAAKEEAQSALLVFDALLKDNAENTDLRANLAASYIRLGDVMMIEQRYSEAKAQFELGYATSKALSNSEDNSRLLAVADERLGRVTLREGDLRSANLHFRQCLDLRAQNDRKDQTAEERLERSVCHEGIGDVEMARKKWSEAASEYRQALAVTKRVSESYTERSDWQRALATTHHKVGNALAHAGDLDEARKHYEHDLAIALALHRAEPERTDWQADLVRSYERIGDLALLTASQMHDTTNARGELHKALEAFRSGLAIARRLSSTHKASTLWQSELSKMYQIVGLVLVELDAFKEAVSLGEESAQYFRGIAHGADQPNADLVHALQNLVWYALLAQDTQKALHVSNEVINLAPDRPELKVNVAHAHMFAGRTQEALALHLKHKGQRLPDPDPKSGTDGTLSWKELVAADFAAFREKQLEHPSMADIEAALAQ